MSPNIVSQLELPEIGQASARTPLALKIGNNLFYENAHELVEAVYSSLSKSPSAIVLEAENVRMIDSSGLKALLQSHRLCQNAGVGFELKSVSPNVARVIHLSGFQDIFGLRKHELTIRTSRPSADINVELTGWKTFEHVATSDPSMISVLRERVADAAREAGADGEVMCDIQIAVGEALTNAYKHGSPNKGVNKIKLRCTVTPKALVVEVQDEGMPFDPMKVAEPDPNNPRENGMGIYLMRQTMDSIDYQIDCPGNRVRMVKWLCRHKTNEN